MTTYATEIIPDLWIGNKYSIEDLIFLSENRFKCIINCTRDLDFNNNYTQAENIRVAIDDHPTSSLFEDNMDMYHKLLDIIKYIHSCLSQNKSILVYCHACKQRSPTIVVAYIMKYGRVSAKQSIEYIKSKREDCFTPRVNFYIALQKFDTS